MAQSVPGGPRSAGPSLQPRRGHAWAVSHSSCAEAEGAVAQRAEHGSGQQDDCVTATWTAAPVLARPWSAATLAGPALLPQDLWVPCPTLRSPGALEEGSVWLRLEPRLPLWPGSLLREGRRAECGNRSLAGCALRERPKRLRVAYRWASRPLSAGVCDVLLSPKTRVRHADRVPLPWSFASFPPGLRGGAGLQPPSPGTGGEAGATGGDGVESPGQDTEAWKS